MKQLNQIVGILLLSMLLNACGGGGNGEENNNNPGDNGSSEEEDNNSGGDDNSDDNGDDTTTPPPSASACNKIFASEDVYIVDLSQNTGSGVACTMTSNREEIASCVEERIRAEFSDSPACLNAFDIFVPGTNQEDGDYTQFTKIISQTPERTYLSVQYSDESTLFDDAIQYDKGVDEASTALNDLLYTLRTRFNRPDVRVFGHSKGSDAVARVSERAEHDAVKFFAFAQAGRTPDRLRGTPGYIEKVANNLVTLTWQNDEVKFFSGGSGGYIMPEIWGFPGYINQAGGGATVYPFRIDHHNNYGGRYSREGFPYCATGNKLAMYLNECKKQDRVRYVPYFWGNGACTDRAFEMMDSAAVGEEYYIGYSGPRASGCRDTVGTVEVDYELIFKMNLADQNDCTSKLEISFYGLEFGDDRADGGAITASHTEDTSWLSQKGTIRIPYHMHLEVWAYLIETPDEFGSCKSYFNSEIYIDELTVSFTHPETNLPVTRTLIGNSEGVEYQVGVIPPLKLLTGQNNVAWRKDRGTWDLHYGIPPSDPWRGGALMAKGPTEAGRGGLFYKWVHLVD